VRVGADHGSVVGEGDRAEFAHPVSVGQVGQLFRLVVVQPSHVGAQQISITGRGQGDRRGPHALIQRPEPEGISVRASDDERDGIRKLDEEAYCRTVDDVAREL
jgi:hypothetical protein